MSDARVVVVAGATGRLGQATAASFLADGHPVVLLGRDQARLDALVASLPDSSGRPLALETDPRDPGRLIQAAQRVRDEVGPASILVDAIGGYRGETGIPEAAADELEAMLDAHVRSAWSLLRAFLPDLRVATGGRVITVSSTTARTPGATGAAYAAAKGALETLTLAAAKELAKSDATANVIVLRMIGDEKRTSTPTDEIVSAIRWLCSPEASAVNGQRIPLVGRA
ncbi:MAG TPA: SDR family oxidoreductase [Candidatus Limnocylindrales bacterium]|nr:SDR family oxidoreductase [Candidatus Limnocylindrales bacterium]